jgi:adenine-specific DNA-methyltransferase
MAEKSRAPRNQTITLTDRDRVRLRPTLMSTPPSAVSSLPMEGIALGDYRHWIRGFPVAHIDLLFLDPPYNLDKNFNGTKFSKCSVDEYTD